MTDAIAPWVAGQKAMLGDCIYTVDRVTLSGRAFVGALEMWFGPDGQKFGATYAPWTSTFILRHVTPVTVQRAKP